MPEFDQTLLPLFNYLKAFEESLITPKLFDVLMRNLMWKFSGESLIT